MPDIPAQKSGDAPAAPGSLRTRDVDEASQLALRLIAANARLNAIALVTVVVLIVLGLWVHYGVKHSLQEIRAAGLQAVLEAEVKALQLWIEDRKADARHWAGDARVTSHVEELVALGRVERDGGKLLAPAIRCSGPTPYQDAKRFISAAAAMAPLSDCPWRKASVCWTSSGRMLHARSSCGGMSGASGTR